MLGASTDDLLDSLSTGRGSIPLERPRKAWTRPPHKAGVPAWLLSGDIDSRQAERCAGYPQVAVALALGHEQLPTQTLSTDEFVHEAKC
jgi:hypothetical protein